MTNEIPLHGKPHTRPADRFMAEQAAQVDPRRAAFARLHLMPEHLEHVPDALRVPAAPADDASPAAAPGVVLSDEVERPAPEYALPPPPFRPPKAAERATQEE